MKQCKNCMSTIPDDAQYCEVCGSKCSSDEVSVKHTADEANAYLKVFQDTDHIDNRQTVTPKEKHDIKLIITLVGIAAAAVTVILIFALIVFPGMNRKKEYAPAAESVKETLSGSKYEASADKQTVSVENNETGAKSLPESAQNEPVTINEEAKEEPNYEWLIEPVLEIDEIYMQQYSKCDGSERRCVLNEQRHQFTNDYVVVKEGDRLDLMDTNGELLTNWNIKSISTGCVNFYTLELYEPMPKDMLSGNTYTVMGDSASRVDFNPEYKEFYGFSRADAANIKFFYMYDNGLNVAHVVSGDNSSETVTEPIGVEISDALFPSDNNEKGNFVVNNLKGKFALYANGRFVTDAIYDECGSYAEGLMAVCKDGKWGYIDQDGNAVIPIEYDSTWKYYRDEVRGKCLPYGTEIQYEDYCYAASEGYVNLCKEGLWELRTTENEPVIAPGIFDEIVPVYKGECWVKKNGKWGKIRILKENSGKESLGVLNSVNIGDTIQFGNYEQDNNTDNGREPIEWKILAIEDGKALILSSYVLDNISYNNEDTEVTWETCSLRKWLNEDFITQSFTENEMNCISQTCLDNPDNTEFYTDGGNYTEDRVFILSPGEAGEYISDYKNIIAYATPYAFEKGCLLRVIEGARLDGTYYLYRSKKYCDDRGIETDEYINEFRQDAGCYWWIRMPGRDKSQAVVADPSGDIFWAKGGCMVSDDYVGVRPAMWINL